MPMVTNASNDDVLVNIFVVETHERGYNVHAN